MVISAIVSVGIKSCVSYNGEQSSFFLRLSRRITYEKVSSVPFVLFLNDLETFLCNKCCNGVNFEFQYDDITLHMELLVLLYADDTFVLGRMEMTLKLL